MELEEKMIELRSEEVQEILGRPPRWILRWGIILLFSVVLLLFVGSWFYKYPDVIVSDISVTTENIPATMVAKSSGKIIKLFVKDKQIVQQNQILAAIENPASYHDVIKLDSLLQIFNPKSSTLVQTNSFDDLLLGDIQVSYINYIKSCNDYNNFIQLNLLNKKIEFLKQQIEIQNRYYNRLNIQSELQKEDLIIAKSEFKRDSSLYSEKVTSEAEFSKSKSAFIQRKQTYESAKTNLLNVKLQISQLGQQIVELQLQVQEQSKQYTQAIEQSYNTLLNSVKQWKQQYLLISPINGRVAFTTVRNENQNITAGDKVFTVIPEVESRMVGRIIMPMQGSGKVKTGQKVNIKFYNFPYMEFGMVIGKVKSISLISEESNYVVEVDFPNGLKTNYGKNLIFSQEMKGSAEIITEDIRLIERFFNPLRSLINSNF
ncbi:MAG: HlyD family efflux transporter periplasmic adaptor subunit [Bacteroidia bacterium]|nr:HlyD family efflux transporter periplasmic adaptor subunit [Bacteroidia bacterium]